MNQLYTQLIEDAGLRTVYAEMLDNERASIELLIKFVATECAYKCQSMGEQEMHASDCELAIRQMFSL
jgi:hypothetical protein